MTGAGRATFGGAARRQRRRPSLRPAARFSRSGHLIKIRHVILCVILALGAWALWPPRDAARAARVGSGSDHDRRGGAAAAAAVKHVIRFHPGSMYLPGVVPENARRPVEGIARVGEKFEQLFPDTRVEFIGVPVRSREWLVSQLAAGQAPDVINVNVEDVWQDVQKNWYVALDDYLAAPNPFVRAGEPGSDKWFDMFKYPVPTRGTTAPDGHMYCIPLDMVETGIYYNKDVFRRLNLSEPRDWSEFLALQQKLKSAGYVPLLVDRQCLADWGLDLAFYQMYGDLRELLDLNYDPRRGDYLHGYLDLDEILFLHRKGFFKPTDPRWREVFRVLKEWRPYMSKDLNASSDMFRSFATQRGAMYWMHSMVVPRLVRDPDRTFEFGIFYLPPISRSYSRFARGAEQCVIGGSGSQYNVTNSAYRDTGDPRTSERLKRVVAFLQFLTLPENCDAVVNEQIAMLPNIKGVEPHRELEPFDRFLRQRYAMTKWFFSFDLRFGEVLLRMLELYLNGGMSEAEFFARMERNLQAASETLVRRKSLDLERYEKVWAEREPLRRPVSELPR